MLGTYLVVGGASCEHRTDGVLYEVPSKSDLAHAPNGATCYALPYLHRERATRGGVEARNFVPQQNDGHPGDEGSQWCNRLR